MAGRSFHDEQSTGKATVVATEEALRLPQVSDGMIQGRSVRLIT